MAAENLLAPTILLLEVAEVAEVAVPNELTEDNNINNYNSINWKQLLDLQKPYYSLKQTPSFIYKYRYRY